MIIDRPTLEFGIRNAIATTADKHPLRGAQAEVLVKAIADELIVLGFGCRQIKP